MEQLASLTLFIVSVKMYLQQMRRLSSTSSHTAKTRGGLPGFIFCTEVSKYNNHGTNKNFSEQVAGTIEARFRKPKSFIEQIGHRSFVIVPYEIRVKKFL